MASGLPSSQKSSRKRIKLECLECGSQFNQDFRKEHERKQHKGRTVGVKHVGAPPDPFIAARNAAEKRKRETESETETVPDTEEHVQNLSLITPPPIPIMQPPLATTSTEPEPPITGMPDESLPPVVGSYFEEAFVHVLEAKRESLAPAGDSNFEEPLNNVPKCDTKLWPPKTWIECAGLFAEFMTNFENAEKILKKVKDDTVANPKLFMAEMIDCLLKIHEESGALLKIGRMEEERLMNEGVVIKVSDVFVDHDPGKRQKIRSKEERQYLISLGPFQPKLSLYPMNKDVDTKKQNRFNAAWYSIYPMLEYSIEKDAAFCFVCSLFPDGVGRAFANPEWVCTGVRKWDKMKSRGKGKKGKLVQHFLSESHKAAMGDYCNFIHEDCRVDILLDKSVRENMIKECQEKEYHKKIILMLIDVARTLARQGLAFRGHDESTIEKSNGNFHQLVKLLSRHISLMKKWLEETTSRSHHVTYLSADSQNEFIKLLGKKTSELIINEIKEAGIYSVIADTTPDLSHKDRLAINVRYVKIENKEVFPVERLVDMDAVLTKKSGHELAKKIFESLNSLGLPISNLMFQSYDYARNMSGIRKGCQEELSILCERLIYYIPCQAHRINIFVEAASEASVIIRAFYNTSESLYVFFSGSTKRYKILNEELQEVENALQIKNLSKTRWTARAESVKAIAISYEKIIEVLEIIKVANDSEFDSKTRTLASGLLKQMLDFDFIVSLYFNKNVMFKIKSLTELLEAEKLNILDASQTIQSTIKSFQEMNEGEEIDNLVESAVKFAKTINVSPEDDFKKHHGPRKIPKRYDDHPETAAQLNFATYYRKEFKLMLDCFTSSMRDNLEKMLSTFIPFAKIFHIPCDRKNCTLDLMTSIQQSFPNFIGADGDDIESWHADVEILLDACSVAECQNFSEISKKAYELRNALPKALKIVKLILTAPISSASSERSFSLLKLILSYLRTTIGGDRLTSLMLLGSAHDIVDRIDLQNIVDEWSTLKHRRVVVK